jgi:hypothetical protein
MSTEARSRLAVPTGGDMTAALSPLPRHSTPNNNHSSSTPMQPVQYMQRFLDVKQMDIQSALDQMKTLLSTRPQVVYKTAYYRKQTKNHWARDDPAFVALQAIFLLVAGVAYSVAFRVTFAGAVSFLLYTLLWNWLGLGLVLASLCREIANRHLTVTSSNSHVRQQVEWLYAFDIHCNSFFPVFTVLYGVQFFLLPVVLGDGFSSLIVANLMYAAALSWYWYITHLGYRALPFLSNTEVFLFPIAAIVLLFVGMIVGFPFGFGWNAARVMTRFYFL